MTHRRRTALVSLAVLSWLCVVSLAAPAFAESVVSVQLKDAQGKAADGKVTLSDASGKSIATCDAHAGQCEMKNVPGGSYTVSVEPKEGSAPKPRKVMIPPSGKVALVVATS